MSDKQEKDTSSHPAPDTETPESKAEDTPRLTGPAETPPEEAQEGTESAAKPERKGGIAGLVVAVFALLIAGGGIGAGYLAWERLNQDERSQSDQINALSGSLQELASRLGRQASDQQQAIGKLRQENRQLIESISGLKTLMGRQHAGWVIAEAEYLMRLANDRLQLAGDLKAAAAGLRKADERLRDLGDPAFLPVREQLSRELAVLDATPRPDLAGLALRISTLSERVEQLPLATAEPRRLTTSDKTAQTAEGVHDWKAFLIALWQDLKSLVVIRRNEQPAAPMLAPEESYFLHQNLRLKLEAARLALLQGDQTLFESNLTTAQAWLNQYYGTSDSAVQAALEELSALAGENIAPHTPDISGSLRRLREIVVQLSNEATTQAVESETPAADASGENP